MQMHRDARRQALTRGEPPEAPIRIPDELMDQVFAEARQAFPNECCGWLSGPEGGAAVDAIRPCTNARASAPTGSSGAVVAERSAERAYVIAGADLLEFVDGFRTARPPRIIFHSHPNGKAYFSAMDQRAASPWGDGPAYDVQHLVVGIDDRQVTEAALFAWSAAANAYVEIARFPGRD